MLIIGLSLRDRGGAGGADSPAYEEHDLKLLPKNNARKKQRKCLVV